MPMLDHPDPDRLLLEKIRRGDAEAFDDFVDSYGERIYGFGMRVCGEREDAREVAQETMLQAFRSLKNVKEPAALRSWLYRVASNACLMRRRRSKFEPKRALSLEELKPRGPEDATFEIPDRSSMPDETVAREELRAAVRRAIETIPAHYRIVLILRDMEQLTTREVADAMQLPESTIKMRLHRARLMVRSELQRTLEETDRGAKPR
jgi:RNA polymerase sigma-70 factor (ECF subfamily)